MAGAGPHLVSERTVVRLARTTDIAAIVAYFRENEKHLAQFTPVSDDALSDDFWTAEIANRSAAFMAGDSCKTFIFDRTSDSVVFGTANLHPIIRGFFQAAFLGYSVAAAQQGKGVMHEALQSLIGYAFSALRLHRIMANYMPANARSGALLERLGFVKEGFAREYLLINGVWEDHILTALVQPS